MSYKRKPKRMRSTYNLSDVKFKQRKVLITERNKTSHQRTRYSIAINKVPQLKTKANHTQMVLLTKQYPNWNLSGLTMPRIDKGRATASNFQKDLTEVESSNAVLNAKLEAASKSWHATKPNLWRSQKASSAALIFMAGYQNWMRKSRGKNWF